MMRQEDIVWWVHLGQWVKTAGKMIGCEHLGMPEIEIHRLGDYG